jgi:hypothetical protein
MTLIAVKQIDGQPVDGGAGIATPQTQRVVIASDQDTVPVSLPTELVTLFGRLRTASDATQLVIKQDTPTRLRFLTEGTVSGTTPAAVFTDYKAKTTIKVGTGVGCHAFRTKNAALYFAGNSYLGFLTFNFVDSGEANVARSVGYFDYDNTGVIKDGIVLEQVNGVLSFVIRSTVATGTAQDFIRVTQANWSNDKFDGSGEGYDFDQTKAHILWFAGEWLGVGDVFMGFVKDTKPILAHWVKNPNQVTEPYMRTANLFLAATIRRATGTGTERGLSIICGALKSEGDATPTGFPLAVSIGGTRVLATAGVIYPILTFRLNPSRINSRVKIQSYEYSLSDNAATFATARLLRNPTFTGGTYDGANMVSVADSAVQYQNNTGTVLPTNLTIANDAWEREFDISTVTLASNVIGSGRGILDVISFLGSQYDNTPDIWCLAIQTTGTSITVQSAIVKLWEQL